MTVTNLADLPDRKLEEPGATSRNGASPPNGTEGLAKAEVTVGGIATAGLPSKTTEAEKVPGLYAIASGLTSPAGSAATIPTGLGEPGGDGGAI